MGSPYQRTTSLTIDFAFIAPPVAQHARRCLPDTRGSDHLDENVRRAWRDDAVDDFH